MSKIEGAKEQREKDSKEQKKQDEQEEVWFGGIRARMERLKE